MSCNHNCLQGRACVCRDTSAIENENEHGLFSSGWFWLSGLGCGSLWGLAYYFVTYFFQPTP